MLENIQRNVIFLNHPDAAKVMQRYKLFTMLMIVLLIASNATIVAIWLGAWKPGYLGTINLLGITALAATATAILLRHKNSVDIDKIRDKMKYLAPLIPIELYEVGEKSLEEAETMARRVLIKQAEEIILLEHQRIALRIGGVTTDLSNMIFEFLNEEIRYRRSRVSKLYDALLEFGLVEKGGYTWAFEEAGKKLAFN